MKKTILAFLFLTLFFSFDARSQQNSNDFAWPEMNRETKPSVRWWWFGNAVNKESITYMLEELSKAGIGGVEITPIYGVKGYENQFIQYLSPQWMEMLQHTITEGKRLGIRVDMATGTGWPFGGPNITPDIAASKLVIQTYPVKAGENFSQKIEITDPKQKPIAELQAVMAFSGSGEKLNLTSKVSADGTLNWTAPAGNWNLMALFCGKTRQQVKRSAPGGEGLVMDHFSSKALDTYLGRFDTAFSNTECPLPNTFFNDSYEVYNADWSPVLPDDFRKLRGYSIEDYLPELNGTGNADTIARVKSDYRETMADDLLDHFTRHWTSWAHSKGAITRNQAHGSPGNLIDLYATVDIPECESFGTTPFDIPGFRRDTAYIRSGDADPMMLKFASSGAHISGKKYVSSETFTWLGEHFRVSLSQCKPQLDELFLSGINHVFFHGTPFSPKDAPWPGWQFYASVNFSPTNRFWRDISGLNEYINRCQAFLQMGKPDNDFLLYFPIYDLWNNPKGTDMPFAIHSIPEWLLNTPFFNVGKSVQALGYDVDFISDRFLKSAEVKDGLINSGGNTFKALIIPPCKFMPVATLQAIIDLAKKGAKVIFVDSLPGDAPGLSDLANQRQLLTGLKNELTNKNLLTSAEPVSMGAGKVSLGSDISKLIGFLDVPKEGAFEQHLGFIRRKDDDGFHYFFANLHAKPINTWISLSVNAASAILYNPLKGNAGLAQIRLQDGKTEVHLQLDPGESVILRTYTQKQIAGNIWEYRNPGKEIVTLNGPWKLSFTEGVPAISKTYMLKSLQSWTDLGDSALLKFSGTGKYSIEFTLPKVNAKDWMLNLGNVRESARVKVNGKDAGILWSIPFKTTIGQYLKPGKNIIEIEVTNIDANRIADYDRRHVPWKIFYDINIVNVNYKPFDASGWLPMPAGLLGPVSLLPLN